MNVQRVPPIGPVYRVVLLALYASVSGVILAGLIALTLGWDEDWAAKFFIAACVILLNFAVDAGAGAVLRRRRLVIPMMLAILAAAAGLAVALFYIAFEAELGYEIRGRLELWVPGLFAISVALAHTGVLAIIRVHSRLLLIIKLITMLGPWVVVGTIGCMAWLEFNRPGIGWSPVLLLLMIGSISSIFSIIGTIVVPIAAVSHANRARKRIESMGSRLQLRMACPDCGERQMFGAGAIRCSACRRRLLIDVEEPRCECGYLLFHLSGDQCPECGRAII